VALSPDLLCAAKFDGRLAQVNAEWERTLGYTPAELTAAPYIEFVHPDDRAATRAQTLRLAVGAPPPTVENRYRRKDGAYRRLLWRAVPSRERVAMDLHDGAVQALFGLRMQLAAAERLAAPEGPLAAAWAEVHAGLARAIAQLRGYIGALNGDGGAVARALRERLADAASALRADGPASRCASTPRWRGRSAPGRRTTSSARRRKRWPTRCATPARAGSTSWSAAATATSC
jgi:PAS domain S-box-containing protein